MKVCSVIAEYNPFHGGHMRQLRLIREAGADMIVIVMSGNFVERGEPAVFDKFKRAGMALQGGADLVVELPSVFSTASAGEFAASGVALVKALGIVDTLCFGVEGGIGESELCRSVDIYRSIYEENQEFKDLIAAGLTYPEAADRLFREYSGDDGLADLMKRPNNILAAMYLRALEDSGIGAHLIPRDMRFRSSSVIRARMSGEGIARPDDLSQLLSLRILDAAYGAPPICSPGALRSDPACGAGVLRSDPACGAGALRSDPVCGAGALTRFLDVSKEMEMRLLNSADTLMSFSDRALYLKTRQYTLSRARRALLHIVLGITEAEFKERRAAGYHSYIRVLGFSRRAVDEGLMRRLKDSAALPVVTKAADFKEQIASDVYRDEIYYSLLDAPGEYTRSPVGPM